MVFLWPVFCRIRTESRTMSLYRKIQKTETRILLYFLQWDKHPFRRTPLGDYFWKIWKYSPLLFCHFINFPEAVPQRNSRSSLPDVFLKKSEHLLRRTCLGDCFWNSWNSSPLFSVCSVLLLPTFLPDIFQMLFTYCVQSLQFILTLPSLILFSLYFFMSSYFLNANVTPISVTIILHTNLCCFWWLCYLQNLTHFCCYCLL